MCQAWDDRVEHALPSATEFTVVAGAEAAVVAFLPTRGVIESWHGEMFHFSVPVDYYAGNCRGVEIGKPCLARDVQVGTLQGSSFVLARAHLDKMLTDMQGALTSLETRRPHLAGTDFAMAVAQIVGTAIGAFVRVHPFLNGNGRTSRLLWRVLLARLGFPAQASVVKRPASPYDVAMAAAMVGDLAPFIHIVLTGLASARPV